MGEHVILQARLASVHVGRVQVLHDIAVQCRRACWTAVVGPNGAGKSTLLRSLAGLQAAQGEVRLKDQALSAWPAKARARTLSWLGQAESGADDLLAHDVVMLGRMPHQAWLAAPSPADQAAVREAMQRTQCWDWRHRPLGQLSGGERQRVLLARALAVQAEVVLMDEPLAHLDPPHQADWIDTVRALCAQGVAVVSVLHELNVALQADELIVMRQGRVCHQGATVEAASHQALQAVFDHRISLHAIDTSQGAQWIALPVAGR